MLLLSSILEKSRSQEQSRHFIAEFNSGSFLSDFSLWLHKHGIDLCVIKIPSLAHAECHHGGQQNPSYNYQRWEIE